MSEVRVNNLSNENNTGGPTISGITTYSGRHFFVPPQGDTASRPEDCEPGSLRFNTDTLHLEYFRGNTIGWTEIEAESSELGGGTSSSNQNALGARALMGGGHVYNRTIEYFTVSTFGDTQDFGDLTEAAGYSNGKGVSTATRGLFAGGYYKNAIEFVTIASTGNSTNFGDLTHPRLGCSANNDTIRGVWSGGQGPGHSAVNIMDYVSISTTGNAQDFGDIGVARVVYASCSSSTRGFVNRGNNPATPTGVYETFTIRTLGNATEFGDTLGFQTVYGGASNATRGIYCGGYLGNIIQFITMSTTGTAQDFGDLINRGYNQTAATSSTRACFCFYNDYTNVPAPSTLKVNVIQSVQIASTGDAVDFGDISYITSESTQLPQGLSNEHGGI